VGTEGEQQPHNTEEEEGWSGSTGPPTREGCLVNAAVQDALWGQQLI